MAQFMLDEIKPLGPVSSAIALDPNLFYLIVIGKGTHVGVEDMARFKKLLDEHGLKSCVVCAGDISVYKLNQGDAADGNR